MKVLVFAAAWLLAIPAWAQSGERLGVGDAVRVTVFQQPDLTTEARVSEKGTLAMPLIGEQKVAGKSTGEAAKQIADALKNGKYLKDPQVSIAMVTLRSRQVSVLGQVARPGPLSARRHELGAYRGARRRRGVMPTGADTVTVMRDGQPQKVDVISKDFKLKERRHRLHRAGAGVLHLRRGDARRRRTASSPT